jgi:hypothetical protein
MPARKDGAAEFSLDEAVIQTKLIDRDFHLPPYYPAFTYDPGPGPLADEPHIVVDSASVRAGAENVHRQRDYQSPPALIRKWSGSGTV